MKYTIIYLIALIFSSCSKKEEKKPDQVSALKEVISSGIVGLGRIEPDEKLSSLATEVGGIVVAIHKKENDIIAKGDLIIELDHSVQDAKKVQIKSRIETQRIEINIAQLKLKENKINLVNKQIELQRLKNLHENGAETRQNVDNLETETKIFQANVEQLQSRVMMENSRLEEVKQELEVSNKELQQYWIKALSDGQIMTMNATKGAALSPNQAFADFIPKSKLVATCEIDELFADKIKKGQKAIIRQIGSNKTVGSGVVIFASSALKRKSLFSEKAGDQEDRRVREIKILLANQTQYLINSRIECVIETIN
ncbi:HlyD family secretion protein [Flavobacterium sp. JAS]|uniref:HlyD family secretion protein n=1 Tax=Flavobacterium sp. JAS TaxID=2897329 RepID=UPI001E4C1A75|nr:biotin/lipoyl-binding protein [Flavobacterium sp. JAS]MCD0472486.1 biotin/lipoyl-binding protein [Flavobacterium sp. JAS]